MTLKNPKILVTALVQVKLYKGVRKIIDVNCTSFNINKIDSLKHRTKIPKIKGKIINTETL